MLRSPPRCRRLGLIAICAWAGVVFGSLALGGRAAAQTESHVVETEHYRLRYEGSRAAAEEAGRVLEAAWPSFAQHFGGEPKLAEGERLGIRFYAAKETWARGIRRDGTYPPRSAGGYYWPPTRTAHLYRQPTAYFTRVLLVHEAAHQFHYLTRTRNRDPRVRWYTEGVAEHLSWHHWNGTRLVLGVVPGVSLKDYPAEALAELRGKRFDLKLTVGGKVPASRAMSWALYSYLATGDDGRPLPGFDAFRRRLDAGGGPGGLVRRHFGTAAKFRAGLLRWLERHQSSWAQGFNEWEEIGPKRMRGRAGVVTVCRLKRDAHSLGATLEVPSGGRWRGGLLLHWTDSNDYTVALYDRWGRVQVNRRRGGRWSRLHSSWLRRDRTARTHDLVAVREGERVSFWIDGSEIGAWRLPGRTLGLSAEASDLRFANVDWH